MTDVLGWQQYATTPLEGSVNTNPGDPSVQASNSPNPYGSGLPGFVGSGAMGGNSGIGNTVGGTVFTPSEEEDMKKYLTPSQQSEVLGAAQQSLAASRATAALDRALSRAESVKETLGDQYDILFGLRSEHYSDERKSSRDAINADYEGRGVYESSAREQSISRAIKAVNAAQTYQNIISKFQLDRDFSSIDYDIESQAIGVEHSLQDEQARLARENIVSQFSAPPVSTPVAEPEPVAEPVVTSRQPTVPRRAKHSYGSGLPSFVGSGGRT